MKKTNNVKYRGANNGGGVIYSLNYKFDSNSIAGKINGTALDLIRRYNDFAKEAQSNNDYVSAEIFRQYAEHYRKIVTEINERKNQMRATPQTEEDNVAEENAANVAEAENAADGASAAEEEKATTDREKEPAVTATETASTKDAVLLKKEPRKSFKIIEITHKAESPALSEAETATASVPASAPKRVYRRRNNNTTA